MLRAVAVPLALVALTLPAPAESAPPAPRSAGDLAAPCPAGRIALTFDDGPAPAVTPGLISLLRRLHAPATFFMVGERVKTSPATARHVESSGFLIGNHSYRHEDLAGMSRAQVEASIRATDAALRGAGVHPTRLMRPPYGSVNATVSAAIRATHHVPALWNVDSRDWAGGTSAQIAARILGQLRPGDNVVLQHDGVGNSPSSVAAVPRVVHEARLRGYCFVGLDEHGRPGFPTPRASLTIDPASRHVPEGRTARLTVTLDAEAGRDTWVRILLAGRTASVRKDLVRPPSVLRIPAGTLRAHVDVKVLRDRLDEGAERFDVRLTDGVGVAPQRGKLTIVIEDRPH